MDRRGSIYPRCRCGKYWFGISGWSCFVNMTPEQRADGPYTVNLGKRESCEVCGERFEAIERREGIRV